MGRRLLGLVLLAPLAMAGMVAFLVVDANLQHWLGRQWLPVTLIGLIGLSLLAQALAGLPRSKPRLRRVPKPGDCAYCGYDLRADTRNPDFCPQCGSSQAQEAHLRRRKLLMLELERLQLELVRNHIARS
jgi:hypothetical protein